MLAPVSAPLISLAAALVEIENRDPPVMPWQTAPSESQPLARPDCLPDQPRLYFGRVLPAVNLNPVSKLRRTESTRFNNRGSKLF